MSQPNSPDGIRPPQVVEVMPGQTGGGRHFLPLGAEKEGFVVYSPSQFLLLHVSSFGLFIVFWFYRQFAAQKRFRADDSWPLVRALLSVFSVFELLYRVELLCEAKLAPKAAAGTLTAWTDDEEEAERAPIFPSFRRAWAYVLASVVASLFDHFGEKVQDGTMVTTLTDPKSLTLASVAAILLSGYPLLDAQFAINSALVSPQEPYERNLGWGGLVCVVLGVVFWLVLVDSLFFPNQVWLRNLAP